MCPTHVKAFIAITVCYTGHTGQKDNKGEKENDRDGRPGTRRPQRADSISLSLDSGIERIRSRGDSSDWEAESIKTMLSTMFETCIDGLLTGEEEEDSDLLRFTGGESLSDYFITYKVNVHCFHSWCC